MSEGGAGGRKQLRLAVVCYGGVSLCIYMHGVTKELHRLVRASQLPDDAESTTEGVYRQALARAAERDDVQSEVVIDIVAGTSAGGINGIFLAKALAHNLSQDALRDLWLEKADLGRIARGPTWVPLVLRAPFLLSQLQKQPPLRGREMSVWLHEALVSMDQEGPSPANVAGLIPDGEVLELYVTMTDLRGYDRQVVLDDPPTTPDHYHRHVFGFRSGDGEDLLTDEQNLALTFAARATSCFPGAFPPISVELLKTYLPDAQGDVAAPFFRTYELSGALSSRRFFIDGGVLNNRPFGPVIDAIRRKRADVEVDRRLLYIEPDPVAPDHSDPEPTCPRPIPTVLAALSGIPRRQPIIDELTEVYELNERVARVREIVATNFAGIAQRVETALGPQALSGEAPDTETLDYWQEQLNDIARSDAGATYTTYLRTKISEVVDGLGGTCCRVCDYPDESNHAFLVRATLQAWAEQGELFVQSPAPSAAQLEFLRRFDLEYGVRRLQFVLAGLNAWYCEAGREGYPAREQLDSLKTRLWEAIGVLRAARSGDAFPEPLVVDVTAAFPAAAVGAAVVEGGFDGAAYLEQKSFAIDAVGVSLSEFLSEQLQGFSAVLYGDVAQLTKDWPPDRRRDLLFRYLGFPLWDVLVYPVQSDDNAGERDDVEVTRMSPLDSRLLTPPALPKLEGVGLGHFRAFLKRSFRENDYLWGRLDAAERIMGLILGRDGEGYEQLCAQAFLAVLDEEGPILGSASELISDLRPQAEQRAQAAADAGEPS